MALTPTDILVLCGLALLLLVLLAVVAVTGAQSLLHPRPRGWASSLTLAIYSYLTRPRSAPDHFLLSLTPKDAEREALTEVVVSLVRTFADCRPERVRELSMVWGLEGDQLRRALTLRGPRRLRALERLLWLNPTPLVAERLARRSFSSPRVALASLLVVIHAKPSQVVYLLDHYPHHLSWGDMERVVEVLRRRSPVLDEPHIGENVGVNVRLFELYLASVEGVGDAVEVARRHSLSPNRELRTAAFNVLLEEAMYPTL